MLTTADLSPPPYSVYCRQLPLPQAVEIVRGISLVHRVPCLNPRGRGLLGARLVRGQAILTPSVTQVCSWLQVSRPLIMEAVDRLDRRPFSLALGLILAGWQAANAAERETAVATIGVGEVWDTIVRVID